MIFVKLSFGWKLLSQGNFCFLANLNNNELFMIEDIDKQKILKLINYGCSLSELEEKYSDTWNVFKRFYVNNWGG